MNSLELLSKSELISCHELGKALVSELDPEKLFSLILNKLSELIPAGNWSLLLVDRETGELCFNICVGIDCSRLRNLRLKPGEGIAGKVAAEQIPMVIEDVSKCEFFTGRIDDISGFKTSSIICVPLIYRSRTVGVIEAINPVSLEERVLMILNLIADYTAIAVENTRIYHYLNFVSDHDNLTGLYNTRFMYRDLNRRIKEYGKGKKIFSIVFMDINNFKTVVEECGHLTGSRIIKEFAETVHEALNENEYCVSYAGDEFVIVMPDVDREGASERIGEIGNFLLKTSYRTDNNNDIKLSASFGAATFPDDGDTLSALLSKADQAMFTLKENNRNKS